MGGRPTGWSIGEVLGLLLEEFPEVSISKIRFLETKGLIFPTRSQGGYRKFGSTDIGRLRWILHHQREHYLPLKVIQTRLAELDPAALEAWASGELPPGDALDSSGPAEMPARATGHLPSVEPSTDGAGSVEPTSSVAGESAAEARNGEPEAAGVIEVAEPEATSATEATEATEATGLPPSGLVRPVGTAVLRLRDLAILSGLDEAILSELDGYGLLPRRPGSPDVVFGEEALVVARLAGAFARYGVEPRHLRMYKVFAEREAAFFEQVLPLARRARPGEERRRMRGDLAELARLGEELRTSALRTALASLLET
ncbi:MAG: MerR family transcriptional regulator [Acidimicrobiia bacterium]